MCGQMCTGELRFPDLTQRCRGLFGLGGVVLPRGTKFMFDPTRLFNPTQNTNGGPRGGHSATTSWPISPGLQPAPCRRDRTSSIRRSADQDCCDHVGCGSAPCDPDTSDSVVGRSELAMVRGAQRFQACDAPCGSWACECSRSPIAAERIVTVKQQACRTA